MNLYGGKTINNLVAAGIGLIVTGLFIGFVSMQDCAQYCVSFVSNPWCMPPLNISWLVLIGIGMITIRFAKGGLWDES